MSRIFITTDAIGGVWNYSLALAAGFENCTLAVLGPAPQPHQVSEAGEIPGCTLVTTGLPLDWLTPQAATLGRTAQALAALAARVGATTAHLHAPCLAASFWPVPVIVTSHSCMATWWDAVRGGPMPASFDRHGTATIKGLKRATHVVAASAAFAAELRRAYALTRPIEIIHNGLPAAPINNAGRRDFIFTAGRMWDAGKNIAVLDQAAASVRAPIRAAGPSAGPDGSQITLTHAEQLGTLPAAGVREMMQHAAIFAAPSLYEPFGLSVLEAAQTGTPLVLSDIPTFRELWNGAATFVPPRDPAAWAQTLNTLLADPLALAQLGAAASTRAARYTQSAMVEATAALHGIQAASRQAA